MVYKICRTLIYSLLATQLHSKYEIMPDLTISANGIIKLLQNLKPDKALGPDHIKPLLLKNLSTEIAPILQVLFTKSVEEG